MKFSNDNKLNDNFLRSHSYLLRMSTLNCNENYAIEILKKFSWEVTSLHAILHRAVTGVLRGASV